MAIVRARLNSDKERSLSDENAADNQPRQPFWGWPPTPKMQIMIITGVCVLINVVLIGVWLLALYLR